MKYFVQVMLRAPEEEIDYPALNGMMRMLGFRTYAQKEDGMTHDLPLGTYFGEDDREPEKLSIEIQNDVLQLWPEVIVLVIHCGSMGWDMQTIN